MERDDLVEENEKCAARLDQLTVALKDQREEKSRLANQVLPSLARKSDTDAATSIPSPLGRIFFVGARSEIGAALVNGESMREQ